ncbi:MAG: sugar phosphate isomerase/epimerase, partial [Clostridia bacterium]|nr:sugar phosphate isomerase/epimerase [Clostridia bacterium]
MKKFIVNADAQERFPNVGLKERLTAIKKAGWDGIFVMWDEQNGIGEVAALAREMGLTFHSVHALLDGTPLMWEGTDEQVAPEISRQIRCLEECKKEGIDLVIMHCIMGMEKNTPNALGVERYRILVEKAKELGITIALENTEGEEYLETLLAAFKDEECVKFCIDTGHEMCYNARRDLITKYKDKVFTTHLNDNLGQTYPSITWLDDSHLLPFDGTADWTGIAKRLKNAGYPGEFVFELLANSKPGHNTHDIYNGLDFYGFMSLAYKRAKKFQELYE